MLFKKQQQKAILMFYTSRFLCVLYYAIYKECYGGLCYNKLEWKTQNLLYKRAKQFVTFPEQIK